jgi:hypothetical protein
VRVFHRLWCVSMCVCVSVCVRVCNSTCIEEDDMHYIEVHLFNSCVFFQIR